MCAGGVDVMQPDIAPASGSLTESSSDHTPRTARLFTRATASANLMTRSIERETKHRSTSSSPGNLAERFLEPRRLRRLVADLERSEKHNVGEARNTPGEKHRK